MFTFLGMRVKTTDLSLLQSEISREIATHRRWYFFEGIVFFIVGVLALALPGHTAMAVEILVASLLIVSGAAQSLLFLRRRERWIRLFSGLFSIVAGAAMIVFPQVGLTALSIVIGLFLILEGAAEAGMSFLLRPSFTWWLLLLSGLAAVVMGILILIFLPAAGIIYISLAIGINMIFYALSLLVLAWRADSAQPQ